MKVTMLCTVKVCEVEAILESDPTVMVDHSVKAWSL